MYMKRVIFIGLLFLVGCKDGSPVNKLLGIPDHKDVNTVTVQTGNNFYTVSCCQDNDGHGNVSWPSFLPQSHIDLCVAVHQANVANQFYNGSVYLALYVDCGHNKQPGRIGDQYYPPTGY